jgi:hypothetical protein
MAFIGGDTEELRFVLTQLGQKTLGRKGLEKEIFYYSLYDQEVNYQVNAYPYLVVDLGGTKKNLVPDSIIFRDNLIA